MPVKSSVPINGAVLRWARQESGLTIRALAERIKVADDELEAWEENEGEPSKGEFTRLVKALKRPSAIFFLPEPPYRAGLPTTFRKAPALSGHKLTDKETDQVRWARRIQEAVSWTLKSETADRVDLPLYDTERDAEECGAEERLRSEVTFVDQLAWGDSYEALREWRDFLQAEGIIVLQLPLGKQGVRGFSAWDDYAPLIAINSGYHVSARIYTLFHEYAHLLTRTDSACLRFVLPSQNDNRLERWCEEFAASFLLPESDFRSSLRDLYGVSSSSRVTDVDLARRIANRFKVSTRAVSLRLQELSLAPSDLYGKVVSEYSKLDWNQGGGGGGMVAAEKRLSQLGARVPEVLMHAAGQGSITPRDLASYLKLSLGQVEDLAELVAERTVH